MTGDNLITKEKFIELIQDYLTYDVLINQADGIFPNIIESKLIQFAWKWHWEIIESYFDEEGQEWIGAYLFEDCKEYYIDGERYKLETIDDLWELVKNYRI